MRISARSLLSLLAASLWLATAASAVTIDWVTVGDPGNAADSTGFGAVADIYRISKYEVTNAQYAEFLNAKAGPADPLGLYNTNMDPAAGFNGGITQNGATYSADSDHQNMPVNFVSFYDALRFANWLHNGQGSGDTEIGAYTLLGGTPTPTNGLAVVRNPTATIFLTSENEWYKAAYHNALGLQATDYFDYPAGFDAQMTCTAPTAAANAANCDDPSSADLTDADVDDLTAVGSFTGSESPHGTFDQGGNVWEWNEALIDLTDRGIRGGSFTGTPADLESLRRGSSNPTLELFAIGFRVASPIPEPGTGLLVMAGVLAMASWRRRRA